MPVLLILATLLGSCASPISSEAPPVSAVSDPRFSAQIAAARTGIAALSADDAAIGVAVGLEGELIWSEAFGPVARGSATPATPDSRFRVYSLMKQFTALLGLQSALTGETDLNASVREALPGLPERYQDVTLQQLLTHSAGVRHYRDPEEALLRRHCSSAREALGLFIDDPLIAEPGSAENYSSYGFVLASAVLEARAGIPFPLLLRQRLLDPAGAEDTVLEGSGATEDALSFYDVDAAGRVRPAPDSDNSCKMGAGGFLSSATDIVALHNLVLSEQLLPLQAVRQMLRGRSALLAAGGASGGQAVSLVDLDRALSIVILSNTQGPEQSAALDRALESLTQIFSR